MLREEGRSAAISYFLGFGQRTSDRFVFKTSFVQVLQHVSTMSGRTEFPFAAALGGDAKRSSLLLVDVVNFHYLFVHTCTIFLGRQNIASHHTVWQRRVPPPHSAPRACR